MKKLPKLYTKNEKGRYEEYDIPTLDTDDTLYRKINGKYVPFSMLVGHDLPEGVWLIMRHRSSTEYISGKFLKENIYYDLGHIKYFCCPKGVIKPEELSENIGLLYENEGAIEIIRIATEIEDKMPSYEVPFIASIMRRLGIKAQTFDFSNRK